MDLQHLSRRERQMVEVVYRKNQATAREILEELQDPPSYSAVRATLAILVQKGVLSRKKSGLKDVFLPKVSKTEARKNALNQWIETFFKGSISEALCTLLSDPETKLSETEKVRIETLLKKNRKRP